MLPFAPKALQGLGLRITWFSLLRGRSPVRIGPGSPYINGLWHLTGLLNVLTRHLLGRGGKPPSRGPGGRCGRMVPEFYSVGVILSGEA